MISWNDVHKDKIAQTIFDLGNYLRTKNIGSSIGDLCDEWCESNGLVDQIKNMNQEQLNYLFGENDPQDYWPRKFKPTLMRLKDVLIFLADREKTENSKPTAQNLIDAISRFDGFSGSCHLAYTKLDHDISNYIDAMPRYATDEYIAPQKHHIDKYNSVNIAYNWLGNSWLPINEKTVEAQFKIGGNGEDKFSKYDKLAHYENTFQEGFRRGNIDVDTKVRLGKTYGDDAIILRTSIEEYVTKFIGAFTGSWPLDLSYENNLQISSITSNVYYGFQPNSKAFLGPQRHTYLASDCEESVRAKINWLRATTFVKEEAITLPTSQGEVEFKKLSPTRIVKEKTVLGKHWDGTALHNQIQSELYAIRQNLNTHKYVL